MADIFISYASSDRDRVQGLVAVLQAAGYTVWWDRELKGGTVFSKEIENAIKDAKVVLGVWTERSVESQWVADEVDLGRNEGKLVPIALDLVLPPIGFRQIQTLDFSEWDGTAEASAMADLQEALAPLVLPNSKGSAGKSPAPDTERREASIAVLPFVNMSADPEQEYFSDGLSEELLNLLAKITGLQVAARTSSFQFKGQNVNVGTIGEDLGVTYVLEGSVRKAGNRVRITGQLIEAARGFHLWSETFDRTLDDVFAIQDEIAAAIVGELKKVVLGDVAAPESERAHDVAAYDYYLLSQQMMRVGRRDDALKGLDYLKRALEIDPDYAAAHARIARFYLGLSSIPGGQGVIPINEAIEKAQPHLKRAMELAPDLAEVYAGLSNIERIKGNIEEAAVLLEKALEISPNDPNLFRELTFQALHEGNPYFDHIELHERMVKTDPLNPATLGNLSTIHIEYGNFERCEELVERLTQIAPPDSFHVMFRKLEILYHKFDLFAFFKVLAEDPEQVAKQPESSIYYPALYYFGLGPVLEQTAPLHAALNYMEIRDKAGFKRNVRALLARPDHFDDYRRDLVVALSHTFEGRPEEALSLIERYENPAPDKWGHHFDQEQLFIGAQLSVYLRQQLGDDDGAKFWFAKLEEAYQARLKDPHGVVFYAHGTGTALALFEGDKAKALDRVEMALAHSFVAVHHMRGLPWMQALEGEPRYDAVMAKLDAKVEEERQKAIDAGLLPLAPETERLWSSIEPMMANAKI